jgi:hypothetical protein
MKVDTYKCDVCGKVKGDVNHWWLALNGERLIVEPWRSDLVSDGFLHLCGAQCVQKKLNEFLSK